MARGRLPAIAAGQGVAAAAVFLLGIATARALGPSGRGIFSTVTFAGVMAGSGALSVVPAVAYFRPHGHREPLAAGVLVALGSGCAASGYLLTLDEVSPAAAFVPLAYALVVTPVAIVTGEVLASGASRLLGLLYAAGAVGQAAAVGAALALGERDETALAWIWVAGFAAIALAVSSRVRLGRARERIGRFLRYMLAASGANVLWSLGARVELFVLAAIAVPAEVGIYAVALAPAQALTILASSYTSSVYHRLVRGSRDVRATARRELVRLSVAAAALGALLAGLIPLLLPLIYGDAFDDSVSPGLIAIAATVVLAPTTLVIAYCNNALGRPGVGSWVAAAGIAGAITGTLLLAPSLGADGAALGSLIGSVASLVVALLVVRLATPAATGEQLDDEQAQAGEQAYAGPGP